MLKKMKAKAPPGSKGGDAEPKKSVEIQSPGLEVKAAGHVADAGNEGAAGVVSEGSKRAWVRLYVCTGGKTSMYRDDKPGVDEWYAATYMSQSLTFPYHIKTTQLTN